MKINIKSSPNPVTGRCLFPPEFCSHTENLPGRLGSDVPFMAEPVGGDGPSVITPCSEFETYGGILKAPA